MKTPEFTKPPRKSPAQWASETAQDCFLFEGRVAQGAATREQLQEARKRHACAARLMDLLDMTPKRCEHVTEALRLLGEPACILVKGQESAYLYFAEGDAHTWSSSSVYTSRLSDQTVREWVEDFERLSGRKLL